MIIMCIQIFLARLVDVSIGTMRTIMMVNGNRTFASILAFFEVIIWFYIAREALITVDDSIFIPIAYAGGFAVGTYIGSFITSKFINGRVSVQAITKSNNKILVETIRKEGFGVSVVPMKKEHNHEKKEMLFIEINKKSLKHLLDLLKKMDSKAFVIVNDTKYVYNGLIK